MDELMVISVPAWVIWAFLILIGINIVAQGVDIAITIWRIRQLGGSDG